ncbi:hypothetical protein ACFQ9X_54305 [Catenulispora yoronensis]
MVASVAEKWGVIGDHRARAVWAEIPTPVAGEEIGTADVSGDILAALEAFANVMDAEEIEEEDSEPKPDDDTFRPGTEPEAIGRPSAANVVGDGSIAPVQPVLPLDWPTEWSTGGRSAARRRGRTVRRSTSPVIR